MNAENEKSDAVAVATAAHGRNSVDMTVTDAEWRTAARALRTASWGTIFYLITTDILGWSGAPFVFASVGYGPGVALYVIFGLAAAFAGYNIWTVFLGLDSSRFPVLSFGDPFLRLFGKRSRHFIVSISMGRRLEVRHELILYLWPLELCAVNPTVFDRGGAHQRPVAGTCPAS